MKRYKQLFLLAGLALFLTSSCSNTPKKSGEAPQEEKLLDKKSDGDTKNNQGKDANTEDTSTDDANTEDANTEDANTEDGNTEDGNTDKPKEIVFAFVTDEKDNHVYKTVVIDGQTWMAENMAYQGGDVTCLADTENYPDFIEQYGCLYSWEDAVKVCPTGWRLPTEADFTALIAYVGGTEHGADLISVAAPYITGNDTYGFGALPAGYYESPKFWFVNWLTRFWTSTERDSDNTRAYYMSMGGSKADIAYAEKSTGFSVRCIKDENAKPKECDPGFYGSECLPCTCKHGTCNDGLKGDGHCSKCDDSNTWTGEDCDKCANSLMTGENCNECKNVLKKGANCDQSNYVDINGTKWAVKNQNTTEFRDSLIRDPITCHYRNEDTFKKYGCLYVWADAKDVCPLGWRLPKKQDFEDLIAYLGGTSSTAPTSSSLRDTSWGGTNTTGFSALPAGYRTSDGRYINFGGMGEGDIAYFWTQDKYEYVNSGDTGSSHYMELGKSMALVTQGKREQAFSVRCIWVFD